MTVLNEKETKTQFNYRYHNIQREFYKIGEIKTGGTVQFIILDCFYCRVRSAPTNRVGTDPVNRVGTDPVNRVGSDPVNRVGKSDPIPSTGSDLIPSTWSDPIP